MIEWDQMVLQGIANNGFTINLTFEDVEATRVTQVNLQPRLSIPLVDKGNVYRSLQSP